MDLMLNSSLFNDFVMPNESLSRGDIDINAFQHKPYLDQQIKDRNYKITAVGNTFIYPIAGYSKNNGFIIDYLMVMVQVAIPNDPKQLRPFVATLRKSRLVKLKEGVGLLPTKLDMIENPKTYN